MSDARPPVPPGRPRVAGVVSAGVPPVPQVLVVEDNAVNQRVAQLMLQRLGYRVDLANNGLEALEALSDAAYDIVLMDVQMPEMDGLEATRRIRADVPAGRQPVIIALTANAMSDDRTRCLAAGMDHHLAKPVRLEQLASALVTCRHDGGRPAARPQARSDLFR